VDGDTAIFPVGNLSEDLLNLVPIKNPFGLAVERGHDLIQWSRTDLVAAEQTLDLLVDEVGAAIRAGLESGKDGIFYILEGAHPDHTTPMQYGGLFLERDRALLALAAEAACNVLWIVGGEETYLDFVSDLPAHVFAWDSLATQRDSSFVRRLRNGAQASFDPQSEIELRLAPNLATKHSQQLAESHV
jgi:hypothetical protein